MCTTCMNVLNLYIQSNQNQFLTLKIANISQIVPHIFLSDDKGTARSAEQIIHQIQPNSISTFNIPISSKTSLSCNSQYHLRRCGTLRSFRTGKQAIQFFCSAASFSLRGGRVPSKALFTAKHLTVLGSFPNCSFKASRRKKRKKEKRGKKRGGKKSNEKRVVR